MKKNYRIWFYPLIIMGLAFLNRCEKDDEIADKDGNTYMAITIGTQVWIIENLKTTKYNDGTTIPNIADNEVWANLTTPGYCWYDNDASTFKAIYGALYNWYAVNTGKLCPDGWHVPSDAEWTSLTTILGGDFVTGGKLKETGTSHWDSPNTGATNETGFTALPGGQRGWGQFYNIGHNGAWWSATVSDESESLAWRWLMDFGTSAIIREDYSKGYGYSVRCLKDSN